MRRGLRIPLALAAAGLNAFAWHMPVALIPDFTGYAPKGASTTGWEAFRDFVLPPDFSAPDFGLITVGSPITNVVFVVAVVLLLLGRDSVVRSSRRIEAAVWICFALNCSWLVITGVPYLRAGYYLWLASFVLLALSVRLCRTAEPLLHE